MGFAQTQSLRVVKRDVAVPHLLVAGREPGGGSCALGAPRGPGHLAVGRIHAQQCGVGALVRRGQRPFAIGGRWGFRRYRGPQGQQPGEMG